MKALGVAGDRAAWSFQNRRIALAIVVVEPHLSALPTAATGVGAVRYETSRPRLDVAYERRRSRSSRKGQLPATRDPAEQV